MLYPTELPGHVAFSLNFPPFLLLFQDFLILPFHLPDSHQEILLVPFLQARISFYAPSQSDPFFHFSGQT